MRSGFILAVRRSATSPRAASFSCRSPGVPRCLHCASAWRLTPNTAASSVAVTPKTDANRSSGVSTRASSLTTELEKRTTSASVSCHWGSFRFCGYSSCSPAYRFDRRCSTMATAVPRPAPKTATHSLKGLLIDCCSRNAFNHGAATGGSFAPAFFSSATPTK